MTEVGDQGPLAWRKSSFSGINGCVEVAFAGDRVAVRDSKDGGLGPVLEFTSEEWQAFLAGARGREFDLPERG
jgi:hypothetical protein